MTAIGLFAVFMLGVFGSVHCIGMCGGIVGALSMSPAVSPKLSSKLSPSVPMKRPFPVAVVSVAGSPTPPPSAATMHPAMRIACYHLGRIGSYALAGAIAGGLARGAGMLAALSGVRVGGYWLANLMLVGLGLYVMGVWRGLAHLEALGQWLWHGIHPLTAVLLPLDSRSKMFIAGSLWGWLPCGMVYGMLLTAMATGTAQDGAAVMTAFGLGSVPALALLGMLGANTRAWMRRRSVRLAGGMLIVGFGLLGLARVAQGMPVANWQDLLCTAPLAAGSATATSPMGQAP